ncbi:MAG: glycosyltransferase, partial [Nostocoides sp.]
MVPPLVRIATRLFPPEVAAAAFRERLLADALVRAGAEVEVITTVPPETAGPADDGDLLVRRLPAMRDVNGNIRGYVQYLSYDLPLVFRAVTRRRPDVWIVEPPPTTGGVIRLVTMLQRRPYVWYAADIWSDAAGSAGAPAALVALLRQVEVRVMRGALCVLSISGAVTARLGALGVDVARVATVGNGVDTSVFTPNGPIHKPVDS